MRPLAFLGTILLIGLVVACPGRAQQPTLRFDRLGVDEGLSQSAVNAVFQDREGFLWVGTDNGLNRYDGYGFAVFRHEPTDPASLPHPQPQAFAQTEDGALWVGTYGGGLARLDTRTGRVTRVLRHDPAAPASLPEDRINALAATPEGTVWIGTHAGLARLAPEAGEAGTLRVLRRPDGLAGDTVRALLATRDGGLWVGMQHRGAQHLAPDGRFRAVPLPHGTYVTAFAEAPDGTLWIGTEGRGLFRYHPASGTVAPFRHRTADPSSLASDDVRALLVDRDGRLWVGTAAGLDRWDAAAGRFLHYRHETDDATTLPEQEVRVLFEDRGGVLWVGMENRGLAKHAPTRFPLYTPDEVNPLRPHGAGFGPMAEGGDGALWFGHVDGTLDRLDPATGRYTPIRLPSRPRGIVPLPDGTAWVGTQGEGLLHVDPRTRRITRMPGSPSQVMRVVPEPGGRLWLATYERGLVLYDPEAGRVVAEFGHDPADPGSIPDVNLYWAERAPDGAVWVGSWGSGAARFDPRLGRVTHRFPPGDGPTGTGTGNVTALAVLRDGSVWAATYGSGLVRLDLDGPVRRYTTADGLPDIVAYGVLEADDGRLWLPTDRGLAVLDREAGRAVAHYERADGLQANEFNGGAFLRASDGRLLVGGIAGYNHFDPASVQPGGTVPLVLTERTAYGAPLDRAEVRHRRGGAVAFSFAALDFARPQATRYAYRLDGADADWIAAGDRRYASYAGLAPGRYTFRVRATTASGATAETAFPFALRPPWFRTWWARGLGLLLFVGLVGWAAREGPALVQRGLARLPRKRLVSHYRLDRKLGQGGAGEVWHAVDLTAHRTGSPREVAVKLLHEHLLDDDSDSETDGRQRLRREADALAAFDHPNIVRVFEGGVWNDTPYLAMELLRGGTLRERLREHGPLPPAEAAALGLLLADALAAVHARGIVHRDLKSDNVMLAAWPSAEAPSRTLLGRSRTASEGDGGLVLPDDPALRAAAVRLPYRPVLMDFGLARGGALTTLTQLGALLGTLGYMAPEQAMGLRAPDAKSDLFSLGVVLYEALTGQLPFRADNEIALLHALFNHEPEPPSRLRPDVPDALSDLVTRCLSKDPAERPESAEAVVRALSTTDVTV